METLIVIWCSLDRSTLSVQRLTKNDKLFAAITVNSSHLLHHLLPPRRDTHYSLRLPVLMTTLAQFEQLHLVIIITLTECNIKTLVVFDNSVFNFNLTTILCISSLTVTYTITYLHTYLLRSVNNKTSAVYYTTKIIIIRTFISSAN